MLAAEKGHDNCVKLLLDEVGMKDEDGSTALMYAAHNGCHECVI